MKNNLTPEEALEIILDDVQVLAPATAFGGRLEVLEASHGRVLAADIVAGINLPPFDNSAMDGYAVVAADLRGASSESPVKLPLLETVAAGAVASQGVRPGTCLKIMTGAPFPEGADAVVMREETRAVGDSVEFLEEARTGQNIRRAGADVRLGEVVIPAGTRVGPAEWAMMASLGTYPISLFPKPRVALIVTGDELAGPEDEVGPGQIRESNSFALRALVEACGAEVAMTRKVGDSVEKLLLAMRELAGKCDAIVTSGGVSAGDFDPVRDVLHEHAEIRFWKVAMKPGKPVMFARFEGIPVFGLPGNPVSVMVAFELFVRPALMKMGGRASWERTVVPARLKAPLRSPAGRTEYVRAHVRPREDDWEADFQGDQGSGRLSTMLAANALLVIPADVEKVQAGETVWARLLELPALD